MSDLKTKDPKEKNPFLDRLDKLETKLETLEQENLLLNKKVQAYKELGEVTAKTLEHFRLNYSQNNQGNEERISKVEEVLKRMAVLDNE